MYQVQETAINETQIQNRIQIEDLIHRKEGELENLSDAETMAVMGGLKSESLGLAFFYISDFLGLTDPLVTYEAGEPEPEE